MCSSHIRNPSYLAFYIQEVKMKKYEYTKKCKFCGQEFKTTNPRVQICSDECRKLSNNTKSANYKRKIKTNGQKALTEHGNLCGKYDCKYMCIADKVCLYLLQTGIPRGCHTENCTKYISRKKLRKS